MRGDWRRHLEIATFTGIELGVAALLLTILSFPLPLLGRALFGIIGACVVVFILSTWRWSVFYRRAKRDEPRASSGGSSGSALPEAAARARFWLRLTMACWAGIMLTLMVAAVLVRFGGLGKR